MYWGILAGIQWVKKVFGGQVVRELGMTKDEYARYLESPRWARKRKVALTQALGRCQVCNSRHELNVHHRTYERVGNERSDDLTVLCRLCHELFHGVESSPIDVAVARVAKKLRIGGRSKR